MTSVKRPPADHTVGGSIPATDEFYTRHMRMANGNATAHASRSEGSAYSSSGVPKMGVRARVAEWPPRKEVGGGTRHLAAEMDPPGLSGGGGVGGGGGGVGIVKTSAVMTNQDAAMLRSIHNTLRSRAQAQAQAEGRSPVGRSDSPDARFLSAQRGATRCIRQRSNSDVTLSELDAGGESGDDWGSPATAGAKWSPVHRVYGSTSSIDQHPGDSILELLKGLQSEASGEQRSPAAERLEELLNAADQQGLTELTDDAAAHQQQQPSRARDKPPKRRSKSETGGESIFRKLRGVRGDVDSPRAGSDAEDGRGSEDCGLPVGSGPPLKPWVCQRGFTHYDVQSIVFDLNEVIQSRQTAAARRKNTTTGASAAAVAASSASASSTLSSTHSLPYSSPSGSQEELSGRDDPAETQSNELVLGCPFFRTETGGDGREQDEPAPAETGTYESPLTPYCMNAGVAVLEGQKDGPNALNDRNKQYIIEHVDLGAYYYRKYFYLRDHWNYFGLDEALGPVALSVRREKLDDHKDHGPQYNYRVIFRTSELTTLRGSILEDAVPSSTKHGTTRGLPLKEVLEHLVPELDVPCLRLALNTPKVTEQLMKLDEQGLSFQVKVGMMYCRAGQSTEEEMYNNEMAGPAFDDFLQLLGEKVRLKGFTKYRAQLDTKTDSTGTHSLYTSYKDYEIMFHVSTMLPYTPNNKQQLLRKRHIGNDIVTIVFQEPGALPFTPKNIRSHFQHVFIIVQVHNPCCDDTCYSVAVTRSRDVPSFGPPVPRGVTFPKSTVFRDFLLAKVVNAENAAHKSDKFRAMATRTRQEYLRDLAERHVTATPVEPAGKFPFISLAHRKRERSRPYSGAELRGPGALTWLVHAEDQTAGAERECVLAVSSELLLLLDRQAKAVVFSCAVRDVIGWSLGSPASMKIFYERGESVSLRSINNNTEDFGEVVKRLELLSKGCQTTEMTLRRNALGQLGFHVNFEGIVAEVEPYGYAWQAGLRQGSRLVEICKVSVASLTHEQMIDLLRTSVTVKVVIIPPHEDSTPRRGCSEMYHMPLVDYKNHKEGMPYELKFPFRSNNNNKWPRSSGSPQQTVGSSAQSRGTGMGGTLIKAPAAEYSDRSGVIPRSVSSDGRPLNPKRSAGRYSPGSDNYALACSIVMGRSPHMRNSPSGAPYGSDANTAGASHWRQKSMPEGFNANRNSPLVSERQNLNEVVNGVKVTPCWPRVVDGEAPRGTERTPTEPPTTKPKPAISTAEQLDGGSTHSPCKSSKTEPPYSSQSSSNTLSSTASSSTHSDEKWYEIGCRSGAGSRPDSELNGFTGAGGGSGYLQGASTDSGIDATSYGATLTSNAPLILPPRAKEKTPSASASCAWSEASSAGRRASDVPSPPAEASSISPVDSPEEPAKSPNNYPPAPDASAYPRSDAASHSSTLSSGHSGSPLGSGVEESARPTSPPSHTSLSPEPKSFYPRHGATSPPSHTSLSPGPKSFYPRHGATSKYLIGWRKPGSTINPVDFGNTRKRHQSEGQLIGQPQLRAIMRVTHSPQHIPKSSIEEDLKKLITLDSPPPVTQEFKPSFSSAAPARRSLQRTLSDESIYSGQRDPVTSVPADGLFSCSTMPRSPTARRAPQRQPSYNQGAKSLGDLTSQEACVFEADLRRPLPDPPLMPLPDASADRGLDWSDLVDAAKAFEAQRANFLSVQDGSASSQQAEPQTAPPHHPSPGDVPACLLGKVSQLESMVKLLQEDLKKEKDAKVSLQAQIQTLRDDNQRLQEESLNASAKLKKFTEWVFNTIDMN
ncbi:signal-induced proliferation-associated 1-like protein 1 isoform X3 [Alosa pseudoharengus]|uniref:signal-induced proliferation-associated 1-like protein 1 isoform X3 n=1 Tax=Alosa pseudoharengus TaxID=34774 RepID=UPI003F889BE4